VEQPRLTPSRIAPRQSIPIVLPHVILDVHEVTGAVRIGLFVANNPINEVDPLGLFDCAALKAQLLSLFSTFQRDSNIQRQFLNGQYNALGNLFVANESIDIGTTVAGAGLGQAANAARIALTSRNVGYGVSLGVDLARSGSLAGNGLSTTATYATTAGGATLGPIASHAVGDTSGFLSGNFAENYTTAGVQNQMQATINDLNADLNQELANINNLMGVYNANCSCH